MDPRRATERRGLGAVNASPPFLWMTCSAADRRCSRAVAGRQRHPPRKLGRSNRCSTVIASQNLLFHHQQKPEQAADQRRNKPAEAHSQETGPGRCAAVTGGKGAKGASQDQEREERHSQNRRYQQQVADPDDDRAHAVDVLAHHATHTAGVALYVQCCVSQRLRLFLLLVSLLLDLLLPLSFGGCLGLAFRLSFPARALSFLAPFLSLLAPSLALINLALSPAVGPQLHKLWVRLQIDRPVAQRSFHALFQEALVTNDILPAIGAIELVLARRQLSALVAEGGRSVNGA